MTEPRYESVEHWLRDSQNRTEVLRGWCDLLEQRGANPIRKDDLYGLAVPDDPSRGLRMPPTGSDDRPLARLPVVRYDDEKSDEYLIGLRHLRNVLGVQSSLGIALAECTIEPSERLVELRTRWNSGERWLHVPVLQGLKSGELLHARLGNVHRVTD